MEAKTYKIGHPRWPYQQLHLSDAAVLGNIQRQVDGISNEYQLDDMNELNS